MKVTPIPNPQFAIEATAEEMRLIADVLLMCGGSQSKSRRGLADKIRADLAEAGIKPSKCIPDNGYRPADICHDSAVNFKDQP